MSDIPLSDLVRAPAIKFEKIGDKANGRIIDARREQARDFDTGAPLVWNDGSPRLQMVLTLEMPDGTTGTLYAKGGNFTPAEGDGFSMQTAIAKAAQEAGATSIAVGAELAIALTGYSEPTRRGAQPAKLYRAQYRPAPAAVVDISSDLFS